MRETSDPGAPPFEASALGAGGATPPGAGGAAPALDNTAPAPLALPAAPPPGSPARLPVSGRFLRRTAGLAVLGAFGALIASTVGQAEPPAVVVRLPAPTAAAPGPTVAPAGHPPAAPTPVTDPVSPVFNAPVLGAIRPVWVEARGQPSQGMFGDLFAATTGVRWRDDGAGRQRAAQVELLTGTAPVPVGRAREMAARLHPQDGQRVGVYVDALGQTVEVFRSAALVEAFGGADSAEAKAVFGAEPAGTYVQVAERGTSSTRRVLLALGAGR